MVACKSILFEEIDYFPYFKLQLWQYHHYTGTESQLSLLISEEHSTVTSFEVKVSSCQWRALLISQILSFASPATCSLELES